MKIKIVCIGFIVLLGSGLVANLPRIPQDVSYHIFADDLTRWGVVNAGNVLSNMAFVLAGLTGLCRIRHLPKRTLVLMWRCFFSAVVLVGLGSAYYHGQPSNAALVWDRLPMTVCFSALTACICAERMGEKIGRPLFLPLVAGGMLSVIYWWITEQKGFGDLRPYILAQYLPMIIIPLMLLLFPQRSRVDKPYWVLLAAYITAKGFEINDVFMFNLTNHLISGHTLKHLAAATGILLLRPGILSAQKECDAKDYCAKYFLTKEDPL